MTALSVLLLITLLWGVMELVWGSVLWYQRRRIRHNLRVEITQRHFAEARNQLMDLARRGEVDVNSFTFQLAYFVNTSIMRRPDDYPAIGAALRGVLVFHKVDGGGMLKALGAERETWTPGVREVLTRTSDGMNYIIFQHSRFWRWAHKYRWFTSPVLRFLGSRLQWVARLIESRRRKDPVVADIRETQKEIDRLVAV